MTTERAWESAQLQRLVVNMCSPTSLGGRTLRVTDAWRRLSMSLRQLGGGADRHFIDFDWLKGCTGPLMD